MGCTQASSVNSMAVTSGAKMGQGSDLDSAVLAATNIGGQGLSNKLELSFKCESLPNMDTFSKSDPFCVVYKQNGTRWDMIGKTELILDNLNPQFIKKVLVDFHFEQSEKFKVEVYDSDDGTNQTNNLSAHDYIGVLNFSLHEIVTMRDQIMTKSLENPRKAVNKSGKIIISAEEMAATANTEICIFNPIAAGMQESGLCFFIILRNIAPSQWTPVYKSEIKRLENGAFRWNQVQRGSTDICKDDIEREIKFEFFRFV